jgi:hypothetical protein
MLEDLGSEMKEEIKWERSLRKKAFSKEFKKNIKDAGLIDGVVT